MKELKMKTHDNFSTLILTTKKTVSSYNKVFLPVVILNIESFEVQKPFIKQNINITQTKLNSTEILKMNSVKIKPSLAGHTEICVAITSSVQKEFSLEKLQKNNVLASYIMYELWLVFIIEHTIILIAPVTLWKFCSDV